MAYLRQVGRQDTFRYVWLGTAAALALSFVVGLVAWRVLGGLEGDIRRLTFAVICFAAVGVLTWMVFWMRRQARHLSRELRDQLDRQLTSNGTMIGIALVPFVAVLREGIETALFLLAVLVGTSPRDFAIGGLLGLAGAVVLGVLVYQSGRRTPPWVVLLADGRAGAADRGGLFARGVAWLQEAAVLPTFWWPVWDLHLNPIVGYGTFAQFLSGLAGWNPRPSIEELAAWVLYLAVVMWLLSGRSIGVRRRDDQVSTPAPTSAAS